MRMMIQREEGVSFASMCFFTLAFSSFFPLFCMAVYTVCYISIGSCFLELIAVVFLVCRWCYFINTIADVSSTCYGKGEKKKTRTVRLREINCIINEEKEH